MVEGITDTQTDRETMTITQSLEQQKHHNHSTCRVALKLVQIKLMWSNYAPRSHISKNTISIMLYLLLLRFFPT